MLNKQQFLEMLCKYIPSFAEWMNRNYPNENKDFGDLFNDLLKNGKD